MNSSLLPLTNPLVVYATTNAASSSRTYVRNEP